MLDDIADLVSKSWPKIGSAVADGLSEDLVAKVIPTELLVDEQPFRWAVRWDQQLSQSNARSRSEFNLATSVVTVTPAHEFRISLKLAEQQLRDSDSLIARAGELGAEARASELSTVLHLLCRSPERIQRELSDSKLALDCAIRQLGGGRRYRLIGGGLVAEYAKEQQLVDEVVQSPCAFPGTIGALLIPTVCGPVLQRIAEDLTLSWRRLTSDTIRLDISERFFIHRAADAATFRT